LEQKYHPKSRNSGGYIVSVWLGSWRRTRAFGLHLSRPYSCQASKIPDQISKNKYNGVHWSKNEKKWRAKYSRNHLGYFDTEEKAARKYDEYLIVNPEYGYRLNFEYTDEEKQSIKDNYIQKEERQLPDNITKTEYNTYQVQIKNKEFNINYRPTFRTLQEAIENRDKKLIFVHDDVFIDDLFLEEKLLIAFESYDIIGLAGATTCDLSSTAVAWHLMSSRENYVGEVAHSNGKNIWTTVFGPTDSRALIIDGLFIAVNTAKLLDTNTLFDENFEFHHYDISFCLRANKNKLKIGVAPIKLTHFGLGDSMNTLEWQKSAEIFKKLYKK
jgi:hypothetical protein